ncbi:MAG: hypothetical protein AB1673_02850 [Actinomycetota bacterium]
MRRSLVATAAGLLGVASLGLVPAFTAVSGAQAHGHGYDVSWPQCGRALPGDGAFRIVGVNGGRPYTDNRCLGVQYEWAKGAPAAAFYVNTANPGTATRALDWHAQRSPDPGCSQSNETACAYNYGYNGARLAFAYAQAETGAASNHSWWLDVETMNSWSSDKALNVASISGALAYLRTENVPIGVYSTGYQWGVITGGASMPELPNWVAGARNGEQAATWCGPERSFTGGPVALVQWVQDDLDHNHACLPLPVSTAAAPSVRVAPSLAALLKDVLTLNLPKLLRDLGS